MTIVNVGVSCRTAPAGVLEKIAVLPGEGISMLARMHAMSAIDEIFVLSTCSRVEAALRASKRVRKETTIGATAYREYAHQRTMRRARRGGQPRCSNPAI
jgi:glutamyl-tRNA reductase